MRDPLEDELDRWMARLSQGDRTAFDPLFRALYPRALRFARAQLGPDRAADAAQSALMKVFARANEFSPGAPALPWFYAIVANEARALARKDRKEAGRISANTPATVSPDAVSPWSAPPDDPERLLVERELRAALEGAIEALDAPAAEAIGALLGRRTQPDIAAATLRKRVSRAYARLRLMLGGFDGE